MDIAFRVSSSYVDLTDFITKLSEVSDKLIVYQHDASRVHIHGLVQGCKISTDTMKNWIKKCLKVKTYPKTDWSFKTADNEYEKYITYMSKGKLTPMYVKEYEDEFVAQCKNAWVDYPKSHDAAKDKTDKPKVWELAQEIWRQFGSKYVGSDYFDAIQNEHPAMPDGMLMYEAYLNIAIDVCNKYHQPFEEHYLRRLVSTAMGQHKQGRKELINKMLARDYKT